MNDAILKLKWAEKRIVELESRLGGFFNPPSGPKPYSIGKDRDAETREIIYYLTKRDPVPPDILLLTGDILQNLRTSLDYAMYALVGKSATKQTGFPIFDRAPVSPDDEAIFARKVNGARKEAIDHIRKIEPYKGANNPLWQLHELNIRDKHRLLFTAGIAMYRLNLGQHVRASRVGREDARDMWIIPRKQVVLHNVGDKLLIDPPTAKVNEDIEFEFTVALNEIGVAEGEPVVPIVRNCLNWVLSLIADIWPYMP